MKRTSVCLTVLSMVMLGSPLVMAQSEEVVARVVAHDERAAQFVTDGDYAAALIEQQAAQALLPATSRLFNMAVCHERLGNTSRAIELYRQFMIAADSPPERRRIALERITALEGERSTPPARAAQPGDGDSDATDLEPEPSQPPAASDHRGLSPIAFSTMLGLTGATVIAAVICGALTLDRHQEFLELYRGEGNSRELQQEGRSLASTTNILIAVAGAMAASTLVLGLVTRWDRGGDDQGEVALVPAISARSATLTLEGRY